ncbi:hypothetical protein HNY73_015165 [Argiope bruennichi]|uniref:Uncharacterized protein n=1 Tax=Argiope bruennichi TaxID=94029 RepID=A0A8T0ESS0_ARGBR|nr:hypothetical protein HNY73_015165 [Argiope bruennichi]
MELSDPNEIRPNGVCQILMSYQILMELSDPKIKAYGAIRSYGAINPNRATDPNGAIISKVSEPNGVIRS